MSDDLDKLPDAALNELFAVEVAGYVLFQQQKEPPMSSLEVPEKWCYRSQIGTLYVGESYALHHSAWAPSGFRHGYTWRQPTFCADANAVLPWLEREFVAFQWNPSDRCLTALRHGADRWDAGAFGSIPLERGAFARAAVIALLRAARAKKESKT